MIEVGHSIYDDEPSWGQFIPAPTEVNQRKFQKQLDRIAGQRNGMSCLRLIWGWNAQIIINGEWRQRYAFHTVTLPSGDTVDLATPRWYIEELIEPAQYRDEWEKAVTELGPIPPNGYYLPCHTIAKHLKDRDCCKRRELERRMCWGKYKEPGDEELELVAYAVRERDKAKMHNRPDEPMSAEVLRECFELNHQKKQEWQQGLHNKVKDCIDQFIHVFGDNMASSDPARHHWGKYHFQGKNGLWQTR